LNYTRTIHPAVILVLILLSSLFLPNRTWATTSTAAFVKVDTVTQGNWKGVYGGDGFNVIGDTSANNPTYPGYATVNAGSHLSGVWAASSTAANCLRKTATGSVDRMAGVWYQTSWSMTMSVTGTHQVALYLLDYPNSGYSETITIKDTGTGAVLSTQSASSLSGGKYYVWTISGNVTISFVSTGAHWAVLSGIFFGPGAPSSTATFVKVDTSTKGNWKGVYGGDGFNVINDTSANNPAYPSYATVTPGSHLSGVWASTSTAANCLQKAAAGSTDRMAGVWYQTGWSMSMTVTGTHQVALYLLDYPNSGYAETVTIKDTASGAVLDTQSASSLTAGKYYVWSISGNVTLSLTSTGGHWAVLSGIFFGGATSKPNSPSGVVATPGDAQVALKWNASTGASSYNIYRGTTPGGESSTPVATNITGTAYTNGGLANGTTYYYKLAAVNVAGTSASL
jgi:hypothetical protein